MFDIIVYSVLLVLGAAGIFYGLAQFRSARASQHWVQCEAVVLDSSIRKHRGGTIPVVRYEYRHEDAVYEGNRIMFSGFGLTSSQEDVEQFLLSLAKGARITVRVCPGDPRVSVMAPGVDRRLWLLLFMGSYFILMGLGGVLGWWH